MKAKKSLGQHFLKSQKALSQIVSAAELGSKDTVLEIGPGTGALTEILLASAKKVVAIEKDRDLIPLLQEKFGSEIASDRLEIIEQDVLNFDPSVLSFHKGYPYKLVANIPYYITGAILEKFLSTDSQPERMVLLMQREVAERIVARPQKGRQKHSVLSVAVTAYGQPRIIARVPPGAFVPAPSVESAILLIENINRDFFKGTRATPSCDEALFFKILKSIFSKKRKQIGGSLTDFILNKKMAIESLKSLSIDPTSRPEDLSILDWRLITQKISCQIEQKSVELQQ